MRLNNLVRNYWEKEPCGTHDYVVDTLPRGSLAWYKKIEDYRYEIEPFIHSVAQFTRHKGKTVLEIGVGAGSDHLQWARAGCDCYGVDLTDAAVETTRQHLAHYGLSSNLQRIDAESLPFEDATFDIVYSWGVVHHSENPTRIMREIYRVLKPGGKFLGMMYGRRSPTVLKAWIKHALLKFRPWRSFRYVVWNHIESIGTKAYTEAELKRLFANFASIQTTPLITAYDTARLPTWVANLIPNKYGWFIGIQASRNATD